MINRTLFPHKSIHKGTWRSPDGRTATQIDHVLIDQWNHTNLLNVKHFREDNSDTGYYLIIAELRG
jgi:hypothetical protein